MNKIGIVLLLFIFGFISGFSASGKEKKPAGMVIIYAKDQSFTMGLDTADLFKNEPRAGWAFYVGKHPVSFTYDFFMDSTLVTQGDYLSLMGNNPSGNITGNLKLPVEQVTWFDAILYCNARSKRDHLDPVYVYQSVVKKGNNDYSL